MLLHVFTAAAFHPVSSEAGCHPVSGSVCQSGAYRVGSQMGQRAGTQSGAGGEESEGQEGSERHSGC